MTSQSAHVVVATRSDSEEHARILVTPPPMPMIRRLVYLFLFLAHDRGTMDLAQAVPPNKRLCERYTAWQRQELL